MKTQNRVAPGLIIAGVITAVCLFLSLGAYAETQTRRSPVAKTKENAVTKHASGTFEVKLTPQEAEDKVGGSGVGRMSIAKLFGGDLEGTSKGQMLAVGTEAEGSAGYVAMERFRGTLDGHDGTFAMQHSGTMTRGAPQLSVTVVPDSGTGELVGLAGRMTINIIDGKHLYEFEYTLAKPQ